MKNLLVILLFLPFTFFGQSQSEALLFEVVNLKVISGKEKAFEAAVKKHNQEYHKAGSIHNARLYYNINGPDGGTYSWIMGPTNFTAMDTRPRDEGHDDDWASLSQYVESTSSPTYWEEDKDLSVEGTQDNNGKSLLWIYDLKNGTSEQFVKLAGQVKEVYMKKRPTESIYFYWPSFSDSASGRDVGVIFPFRKWAWLDREATFRKEFEEVHGAGTFDKFLDEFDEITIGRTDFMRERIE